MPLNESFTKEYIDFNRYCDTFGLAELRTVLKDKLIKDNHLAVEVENILITNGASNALSASVMSIVEKGEDVLLLTPCWPLFQGMVKTAEAHLVEIPFYTLLYQNPELDIESYLAEFITQNSVAIYLNSPNNPSGKVLNYNQLQQIARFAAKNDLWILSDEAYDGLTYDELEHISIASVPDVFNRTIAVYTFSKIFMFAGLRLGYAVGAKDVITNLNKIMVYQIYGPATFTQQMMIEPVKTRHQWMHSVRMRYQELRDIFLNRMQIPLPKPEATYFIFFPVQDFLQGRNYEEIINACFDKGVSVAPGEDFGKDFSEYIRICFTGETPERMIMGIDHLNEILF
jgi:aspartate/methionine/tyrosine aminotransferase